MNESSYQQRPTKRAPDAGDSAAISSSFTRLSLFLAGRLCRPRPSAGNACRWHAPCEKRERSRLFREKSASQNYSKR